MNDFEVKLTTAAEDDLADIWLNSPDPSAVTRADTTADRMLRRDPLGNGTLVVEGLYRLIVAPLVYYYAVDTAAKLVEVSAVREIRS
jgi:hypothetical protein